MVFELSQFDVMEHLWNTLEKTKDGEHVHYNNNDIDQLWLLGFVDTENVDMEEWRAAFEPFKKSDGSYILTRDDFFSLDEYRYKGEIRVPFDPMQINEGKYTDDGLEELFAQSIIPSCRVEPGLMREFINAVKEGYRQTDGLIRIDMAAKDQIRELITGNPSPLRNLELIFDHLLREKGLAADRGAGAAEAATAEVATQVSQYTATPTSRSEKLAAGLKNIEKKKDLATEVEGVEKIELKKIRRSRKGLRG